MSAKKAIYGFGFDPDESQNHFFVVLPEKGDNGPVRVFERFEWTPEAPEGQEQHELKNGEELSSDGQIIRLSDNLRMEISRHKWNLMVKDITAEFNTRLREEKKPIGRFVVGGTPVERLFGKEMMVLLWGVEDCDPSNIPTAIKNWKGLMPEERWWLYTTTNASTGGFKERKGWRAALRYALCENPIEEDPQMSFSDFEDVEV